jgi:hypothetical protein
VRRLTIVGKDGMGFIHVAVALMLLGTVTVTANYCAPGALDNTSGFCICDNGCVLPGCMCWTRECGAGMPNGSNPLAACDCSATGSAPDPVTGSCLRSTPTEELKAPHANVARSTRETSKGPLPTAHAERADSWLRFATYGLLGASGAALLFTQLR